MQHLEVSGAVRHIYIYIYFIPIPFRIMQFFLFDFFDNLETLFSRSKCPCHYDMGRHHVAVREDGRQIWSVDANVLKKQLQGFFQTGGCRSTIYRVSREECARLRENVP